MNLFETVKAAVTVRQAAEHYGLKVERSGMIRCPFHDDRHPSMKLNESYFYCFGCGATGDVIDFVARLFGLSSYEAAQKLAYDFGIDPDKPPAAAALSKPKYPLARAFRQEELHCQRVLCDYLHLLEDWKVQYAPKVPEEGLDVYVPLVDDHGVDCVIKKEDGTFIEVQIKARSNEVTDGDAALFSAITHEQTEKFYFVFYSERLELMWIMSSEEFLNECVTNKTGKNKGKRGIWFNGNRTDKKIGVKKEYCKKQFEKYIATDFSRFH